MKLDFVTFVLLCFGVSYLIGFIVNRMKNKVTRRAVARYIRIINMILTHNKQGISATEYNDRYTIVSNMKELSELGLIRLLKGEKRLIILDHSLQLTDKEYKNIVEVIKPVL